LTEPAKLQAIAVAEGALYLFEDAFQVSKNMTTVRPTAYEKWRQHIMTADRYRIQSRQPLMGSLLPPNLFKQFYGDRSLAVAVAVKSVADPTRQQVQVVYVPTGEIVFETAPVPL
jgi:hypothetical protein